GGAGGPHPAGPPARRRRGPRPDRLVLAPGGGPPGPPPGSRAPFFRPGARPGWAGGGGPGTPRGGVPPPVVGLAAAGWGGGGGGVVGAVMCGAIRCRGGRAGAGVVQPGGDGVLPGLQVGGVASGEFAELATGGAGERGQLIGDLDLAVAADGVDGDGHGTGLVTGVTRA